MMSPRSRSASARVFFSIYLGALVEEITSTPMETTMLPELPISRRLLAKETPTERA